MNNIQYIKIIITGIVQGVSFRSFTKNAADNLNISGWVKNLPDGSVEALAIGAKKDIEKFISELKTGPPTSRVDNIEIQEQRPAGTKENQAGFHILRA